METISRVELEKKIDSGEALQLVDVRGRECCYDNGHLPGAKSIPLNDLEERGAKELDKNELVVVYCGSFSCSLSPRAAEILKDKLGFKDVLDYEGGFLDWKNAGNPIET
ncbi:MAG: rhodanese-like domain-containing protein [Nitrospinota bacterium]